MAPHPPQSADVALDAAARARVTLIVGAGDTGKTTLTARLATALAARGERVALVDTDVGQSEIGPPTTVGLGAVRGPITRPADAALVALEFVGDTSPARYIRETADAAGRLVRRALAAGFTRVLVDTGGMVEGGLALALKRAKARAVDPDLVLVLQRHGESEAIARALEGAPRPVVLRLAPAAAVAPRSATRRREHRERALRAYFAGAATLTLDTDRVPVTDRRGERPAALEDGLLLGVLDARGETLGLARARSLDATRRRVVVETPVPPERIAALRTGRAAWRPA